MATSAYVRMHEASRQKQSLWTLLALSAGMISLGVIAALSEVPKPISPSSFTRANMTTTLNEMSVGPLQLSVGGVAAKSVFWILFGFVGLFYTLLICGYIYGLYLYWRNLYDCMGHLHLWKTTPSTGKACLSRVAAETILDIASTPIGLITSLTAAAVAQSEKVPPYVMVLLPVVAFRGLKVQADLMGKDMVGMLMNDFVQWSGFPSFPTWFGVFGIIDGVQHGFMIGAAFSMDDEVQPNLVANWQTGPASSLEPVISALHLGGLMLASWAVSAIFSLGRVALILESVAEENVAECDADSEISAANAKISSLIGFGALQGLMLTEADAAVKYRMALTTLVVKFMGESILYLQWQTSLAMAQKLDVTKDFVVSFGLVVSIVMGLKQSIDFLFAAWAYRRSLESCHKFMNAFLLMTVAICICVMLTRIGIIFLCPSHAGGVTTGCI